KPRRLTYNCPSGNWSATRWAQCTASAVLPTPAVPDTAEITTAACPPPPTTAAFAVAFASSLSSRANWSTRPANPTSPAGSCAGPPADRCPGPIDPVDPVDPVDP